MNQFKINTNNYLSKNTKAFFHVPYIGMGNIDNPNYLNDLKNTFNDFSEEKLRSAVQKLQEVLETDLPEILRSLNFEEMVVCVVPRAKAEKNYHKNQQLFRATVQNVVNKIDAFFDGTSYLRRDVNTKTTHFRKEIRNYNNDGEAPYPGITAKTCNISTNVKGKNILLIDDIYTLGVNIDEDAINALLNAGASTVTFYAVGKVEGG